MQNKKQEYLLTSELKTKIDKNLTKYPKDQKQSAVVFALKEAQKENKGWLEEKHIKAIAKYLDMEKISVYEVATFYSMIKLEPVGEHVISICNNVSCKLAGADKLVKYIEDYLNIKISETTKDGKITLQKSECLASCASSPVMLVDDEYHEELTQEKIKIILDKLTGKDIE